MVDRITFTVTGAKQLEAAMKELGVQAANRIARSALNRSATPIVQKAKELAPQVGDPEDPHATGLLKRSITKRLRRQRRGSSRQSLIIGIERPVASRYAHLLEFGSAHQAAEPFLRPALDEQAHAAIQVMTTAMRDGVEREIRKLAVKRAK